MTKIIWTHLAVSDLESIHDYISRDSKVYADALLLEIFHSVDQVKQFPKLGRVVPELSQKNTREVIVGNYRIIYDIKNSTIRILTVLHGARLFQNPKEKNN